MSTITKRNCTHPGCRELTTTGKCPTHKRLQTRFYRGTKNGVNYGHAWRFARDTFMSRPENLWCIDCTKEGKRTLAEDCDHEVPHRGDPDLFWDQNNWRPRCKSHHSAKTAREVGFGGGGLI